MARSFQMQRRKDRDREKEVLQLNSFYFNDNQSPRIAMMVRSTQRSSLPDKADSRAEGESMFGSGEFSKDDRENDSLLNLLGSKAALYMLRSDP